MGNHGNLCETYGKSENLWEIMGIYVKSMENLKIYGKSWEPR